MKTNIKISTRNLNFFYGKHQALFDNNLDIYANQITAVIGPSGCGKSTHLRIYNRIFELYRNQKATGEVRLDGKNILAPDVDLLKLRHRVGMIFQKPTPFPMSIADNVAYPLKLHYKLSRSEIDDRIEEALRGASLWDEVKDKLKSSGLALSGGQQQRLCIARALAAEPEVLLMDEPTSAIDPVATLRIEELILELKKKFTIVIVTHNLFQARRIADDCIFMLGGELWEQNTTEELFGNPQRPETRDYLQGVYA